MTIAVVGAFDEEIEKLIDIFSLKKIDNRNIFTGEYDNKKLIVCNSGIGKVNAAATTQYIIDKYNPKYIINSGCCGSLDEKYKILDIILSLYVTYHDFLPTRIMMEQVPDNGCVKASEKLLAITEEILNETKISNYYIEPIATGDCFVTDEETRDKIKNETGCAAVDMESACIGHVSKINNVEFISIKTISDFSDGVENFEVEAAYKSSLLVKKIIEKL